MSFRDVTVPQFSASNVEKRRADLWCLFGLGRTGQIIYILLFLGMRFFNVFFPRLQDMPEAAGAVAAAAVADRLLGPKERRQLAIVLVTYA